MTTTFPYLRPTPPKAASTLNELIAAGVIHEADRPVFEACRPSDEYRAYAVDRTADVSRAIAALVDAGVFGDEDTAEEALQRGWFGNCDDIDRAYRAIRPHGFAIRGRDTGRVGGPWKTTTIRSL